MAINKVIKEIKSSESLISMVLGIVVVIVVGVLLFNYFKSTVNKGETTTEEAEIQAQQTPSAQQTETEEERPSGPLPQKYTVQEEDSLWKISIKFYGNGFNWVDISTENKIANPDILLAGQELTIPIVPAKISPEEKALEPISGNSYQVVKGDSLWEISVRAYQDGYKWPQIAKANNLANPDLIHPGNTLTLPR